MAGLGRHCFVLASSPCRARGLGVLAAIRESHRTERSRSTLQTKRSTREKVLSFSNRICWPLALMIWTPTDGHINRVASLPWCAPFCICDGQSRFPRWFADRPTVGGPSSEMRTFEIVSSGKPAGLCSLAAGALDQVLIEHLEGERRSVDARPHTRAPMTGRRHRLRRGFVNDTAVPPAARECPSEGSQAGNLAMR